MSIIFRFIAVIAMTCSLAAHARPCASPLNTDNEETVTLVGRLHQETNWGPPGFGEDPKADSKFTALVLLLDKPIRFHLGNVNSVPKDVTIKKIQVQLNDDLTPTALKRMLGRMVSVSGVLYAATTGGDVTPVVVDSNSVKTLDDSTQPMCSMGR